MQQGRGKMFFSWTAVLPHTYRTLYRDYYCNLYREIYREYIHGFTAKPTQILPQLLLEVTVKRNKHRSPNVFWRDLEHA
jgi:hypothetical protein